MHVHLHSHKWIPNMTEYEVDKYAALKIMGIEVVDSIHFCFHVFPNLSFQYSSTWIRDIQAAHNV